MLLTIIFDFRVIKLRNYHKISHLGHVNEILMQNPVCAMWRLIRVEQKIVWLYKQLVYCPDHNVITILQQWCDCTRPWSEGRREGGTPGSTWHCLCITFILPLYSPAHDTQHTAATSSRENKGDCNGFGEILIWFLHPRYGCEDSHMHVKEAKPYTGLLKASFIHSLCLMLQLVLALSVLYHLGLHTP